MAKPVIIVLGIITFSIGVLDMIVPVIPIPYFGFVLIGVGIGYLAVGTWKDDEDYEEENINRKKE